MKSITLALLICFSHAVLSATSISPSNEIVAKAKAKEWLLIDVRKPAEYATGHIPGAINIPHDEIASHIDQIASYKNKPVILYCRTGYRASKALKALSAAQFSDLRHLDGDFKGWQASKLPISQD